MPPEILFPLSAFEKEGEDELVTTIQSLGAEFRSLMLRDGFRPLVIRSHVTGRELSFDFIGARIFGLSNEVEYWTFMLHSDAAPDVKYRVVRVFNAGKWKRT